MLQRVWVHARALAMPWQAVAKKFPGGKIFPTSLRQVSTSPWQGATEAFHEGEVRLKPIHTMPLLQSTEGVVGIRNSCLAKCSRPALQSHICKASSRSSAPISTTLGNHWRRNLYWNAQDTPASAGPAHF